MYASLCDCLFVVIHLEAYGVTLREPYGTLQRAVGVTFLNPYGVTLWEPYGTHLTARERCMYFLDVRIAV